MDKQIVRQVFEQIAASLALKGDNPFRVRAFENAARAIAGYDGDLAEGARSGTLARYINEDGITGVTANPAIFEKAIAGSHDYVDTIRAYGARGCTALEVGKARDHDDTGLGRAILI